MTFVVRVWVPSFVVVLSALLCPGRQVATRSSSPLGWFWSFPWPQVAPCLLWLGRSWGGMVKTLDKSPGLNFAPSLLNFVPSLLNFIHNSLSLFHTSSLPSSPFSALWLRYASLGSPPPCSRPLRRGRFELVYLPPSPPPLLFFPGSWWLPLWVGRGFARCCIAWGLFHCQPKVDFIFLCLKQSKMIVQITLWWLIYSKTNL